MGDCTICGKSAGLLRNFHKACQERRDVGWSEMLQVSETVMKGGTAPDVALAKLEALARDSFIAQSGIKDALVYGWSKLVDGFLEDGLLSEDEEEQIKRAAAAVGLDQATLESREGWMRLVRAAVLREVMEGATPSRMTFTSALPFNLLKSESLVWLFPDAQLFEERIKTHYEGRSQGVSLRIAKGVYYRTSAFRGQPIQTTHFTDLGSGLMGITTSHIYFHGAGKQFRVPYSKIVSFSPYADGIGITRDAASAKPYFFRTGDGWFTYNLVMNLAER